MIEVCQRDMGNNKKEPPKAQTGTMREKETSDSPGLTVNCVSYLS